MLTEHTYRDRLAYIAEKALGMPRRSPLPHVTAIAAASSDGEAAAIHRSFRRQHYRDKSLVLVLQDGYSPSSSVADEEAVSTLTWEEAESQSIQHIATTGFR